MSEVLCKVDFEPLGKRVEVKKGLTLLDAARQAGVPLTSDCGGAGSCGQCLVIAREQHGKLSEPNSREQRKLSEEELRQGYRLACQADVLGDVKIDVPISSLISGQRLQVDSKVSRQAAYRSFDDLVIQPYTVTVDKPDLHDLRGDLERVLDALSCEYHLSGLTAGPAAVRSLSGVLRENNWTIQALVRDNQIISFLAPGARPVGMAVDLGTTKVAAFLVDLVTGETLASQGRPNPQIGYGEDVISRMVYAMNKPDGMKTLSHAVYETLCDLAKDLSQEAGVPLDNFAEACIVGNTAMTHLLLQLPVSQLALSPYVPATALPQESRAVDMGLPFAGDARVYVPSCVAGYVGADLVAMAYASGIGQDDRTVLGIDIGTNTEIILSQGPQRRMISLSCASGPAFEGAHIKAGMRAADGAIERVRLDGLNEPEVQTIGGSRAVGICGSGIIDAIAELYRTGTINNHGRFQNDKPRVRIGNHGKEFLLVDGDKSGTGEEITITQGDVDEIQMAKGAIMAGITVLLQVAGLKFEDLDEIILAGAFGTYLNLETSIAIGLLPNVPLDRYRQVGNAAGEGARRLLVSKAARARASEMARQIEYVELTVYPGFRRIYAKSMMLG